MGAGGRGKLVNIIAELMLGRDNLGTSSAYLTLFSSFFLSLSLPSFYLSLVARTLLHCRVYPARISQLSHDRTIFTSVMQSTGRATAIA